MVAAEVRHLTGDGVDLVNGCRFRLPALDVGAIGITSWPDDSRVGLQVVALVERLLAQHRVEGVDAQHRFSGIGAVHRLGWVGAVGLLGRLVRLDRFAAVGPLPLVGALPSDSAGRDAKRELTRRTALDPPRPGGPSSSASSSTSTIGPAATGSPERPSSRSIAGTAHTVAGATTTTSTPSATRGPPRHDHIPHPACPSPGGSSTPAGRVHSSSGWWGRNGVDPPSWTRVLTSHAAGREAA